MSLPKNFIPLSKPYVTEQIFENIKKVFQSGKLSGDGVFCHQVEKKMSSMFDIKHVLLTTSGTHALEMCLMLLDANPGDEVILPSFTFSSTANAVLMAGLKPVFCEIEPVTMNMDMNDVAKKITARTKGIIPVHYAGVSCDMEKLFQICRGKQIQIIEDAAQGVGAKWKDQFLGTIGHMGAYSFHDTKNVMCGEGGAFLTKDDALSDRGQIIREKGTNRSQFMRGQVDKYTWIEKGSSYVLAEPLAAILDAQVDLMQDMNKARGDIYHYYMQRLKALEDSGMCLLPKIPANCTSNYHLFHMILRSEEERNALMDHLRSKQVGATFHYISLHSAPAGQKLGYKKGDLPVTEDFSSRLLRLPLHPRLTAEETEHIVNEIYNWAASLGTSF